MKTISKLGIAFCLAAVFSYADSFTGKLVDASCYDKTVQSTASATANATPANSKVTSSNVNTTKPPERITETCAPTASTTMFAFMTSSGKIYKLDNSGNMKVQDAMKNGTLKADTAGYMNAGVTGTLQGDHLMVSSVRKVKNVRHNGNS
ncbi:MAG TPA: hypothetical protein VH639_09640 [Bryobacteraceae bacterium]|jgi:hypothetical protein